MALNSLALTRVFHMSRVNSVALTEQHMDVLEYAWRYYRKNSVGPLYQNIRRHTGITRQQLARLFPHGLNSVFTWIGIPIQGRENGCKAMVSLDVENPREVYLDHNATTPLRPEVKRAMVDFLENPRSYGNASSAYEVGSLAFDAIDQSRRKVATGLGVNSTDLYFTGSGTEANNLAIRGLFEQRGERPGHFITTAVEHPSVLRVASYLESRGHNITLLPVLSDGSLRLEDLRGALREDTVAVSVMAANNEIGTIYPLAEIGHLCRQRGVPLLVDAIQGFGKMELKPRELGVSVLTLSGHKIGAPKGVGAIYVDPSIALAPQTLGGSQESGLRSGTENVLGIHALGIAAELAVTRMPRERERLLNLRQHFLEKLWQQVPGAVVNGTLDSRLPNNLSIGFPGVDSGSLLLSLNQIGIYVSAGSACSAGNDKHSHVLEAIGSDLSRYGTIRFSFGCGSSTDDIDYLFEHLPRVLDGLRN